MAINVFHIVSDKVWGGVEQYVYDLAAELRATGNYIEIVAKNRRVILDRLHELEVPVSILPLKGLTDIDSPLRFARLIKKGKNIVHVHNVKDAAMAMLARHISENPNTKIVMTCHEVKAVKRSLIYKTVYRDLDKIIFVSELAKDVFMKSCSRIDPQCTTVIHNSGHRLRDKNVPTIDIRAKYGIPDSKCIIMFHGHVTEDKGISILLRALTQLDKNSYHLVIIGAGETKYLGIIKAFIVANQLLNNVTFLGYQSCVQPLLAQCDFGVLPSVCRESFGLTNLEYMMVGKAHIATNNGAQKEYVDDEQTGLLVAPGDYRELACAIEKLIDNPEYCKQIGDAAMRKFDKELCYRHFFDKMMDTYKSLF